MESAAAPVAGRPAALSMSGVQDRMKFARSMNRLSKMMESWLLVAGSQMRGVRRDGSSTRLPEITIATDNFLNFPCYLYPVDHLLQ